MPIGKIHTHATFIKINSWWHFNSYLCLLLRLFNLSREKENDDGRKKRVRLRGVYFTTNIVIVSCE